MFEDPLVRSQYHRLRNHFQALEREEPEGENVDRHCQRFGKNGTKSFKKGSCPREGKSHEIMDQKKITDKHS